VTQAIRTTAAHAAALEYLQNSRRGLLVQLAGIGDLVMALPAIESLRAGLPHIRWTLATRPANGEVLMGRVDEIRTLPWPPTFGNTGVIVREVIRLRRARFDVAIHLYSISRIRGALGMKALFLGVDPCLSIGRCRFRGLRIFDVTWDDRSVSSSHEMDLNLDLINRLGLPRVGQTPVLTPQEEALRRMTAQVHERFGKAQPFVAVFPGGKLEAQQWPVAYYSRIAERLSAHGFGVCVIGGEDDVGAAQAIAESAGRAGWNLAGRLTLQEVIALLPHAAAYIGNDSGPTHIAAALGVPCVALFRLSEMAQYAPRGRGRIRVLHSESRCLACERINGARHTCLESVAPETLWDAIRDMVPALR
jgi:heptosyltransferase-1